MSRGVRPLPRTRRHARPGNERDPIRVRARRASLPVMDRNSRRPFPLVAHAVPVQPLRTTRGQPEPEVSHVLAWLEPEPEPGHTGCCRLDETFTPQSFQVPAG